MTRQNDTRLLSGIDIFIEASFSTELPQKIGTLKLSHTSSRGTKLKGDPLEKDILDVGWICARYLFENPRQQGTDANAAICELIEKVGSQHTWSSVIKLYSQDGKALFS